MKILSCTCGGFVQDGAFVHAETCGRPKGPTRGQLNKALSGDWSYDQAILVVRELRKEVGDGWEWLTPRVRACGMQWSPNDPATGD